MAYTQANVKSEIYMDLPLGFGVDGSHPREWVIITENNFYGLKGVGLEWFEKLKEGLEAIGFVQSQVYPYFWYKEEMVLLFYIGDCLMFSPSKDKIEEVYASIQTESKIEYDVELKKYLGIELGHCLHGSIHLRQPYLIQIIINMIPGMEKSSAKPSPAVKPCLAKNEGAQAIKNDFNYRSVIGSLNFLTNSMCPEA